MNDLANDPKKKATIPNGETEIDELWLDVYVNLCPSMNPPHKHKEKEFECARIDMD